MATKNQKNNEPAKGGKPEIDVKDVISRLRLKRSVALADLVKMVLNYRLRFSVDQSVGICRF